MNRPTPAAAARPEPILVEIGSGELIDKITILQIKAERIADPSKLVNVRHELAVLEAARRTHGVAGRELAALEADLKAVNLRLWVIEDEIRACEARGDFGDAFIALARAVYGTNDRRAALKKSINLLTGAAIVEEKSYAHGQDAGSRVEPVRQSARGSDPSATTLAASAGRSFTPRRE